MSGEKHNTTSKKKKAKLASRGEEGRGQKNITPSSCLGSPSMASETSSSAAGTPAEAGGGGDSSASSIMMMSTSSKRPLTSSASSVSTTGEVAGSTDDDTFNAMNLAIAAVATQGEEEEEEEKISSRTRGKKRSSTETKEASEEEEEEQKVCSRTRGKRRRSSSEKKEEEDEEKEQGISIGKKEEDGGVARKRTLVVAQVEFEEEEEEEEEKKMNSSRKIIRGRSGFGKEGAEEEEEEEEELTQTQSQSSRYAKGSKRMKPLLNGEGGAAAAEGGGAATTSSTDSSLSSSSSQKTGGATGVAVKGGGGASSGGGASGSSQGGTGNRRDIMRKVAENRAAHFARADARERVGPAGASAAAVRSARSTTPLPSAGAKKADEKEEKEQWPGPFATARRMMRERQAAAQARQERIEGGQVTEDDLKGLETIKIDWEPVARKRPPARYEVSSLGSICLKLLLEHVDALESLGYVTTQVRYQFAEALAKEGRLSPESVLRIVHPGLIELYLPDCKLINEASLITALEKVAEEEEEQAEMMEIDNEKDLDLPTNGGAETAASASSAAVTTSTTSTTKQSNNRIPSLQILRLRWCGQSFGRRTVEALDRLQLTQSLHLLELTGLYRLPDPSLIALLGQCPRLVSLDLPYKSNLTPEVMQAIVQCSSLHSLSIAYCANLDPKGLEFLRQIKGMKKLDLSGLPTLRDEMVEEIVAGNKDTLTHLAIRQCKELTNQALESIGQHCHRLVSLDGGELYHTTAEALQQLFTTSSCARTLEEVYLRRGPVNDDVILALAIGAGKSLRHLDVNSTGGELTDASIVALAKFCNETLEHLDFSFCRKISNEALGHLTDACPRLKTLTLWGCTQVTDRFLKGHRRQHQVAIIGRGGSGSRIVTTTSSTRMMASR